MLERILPTITANHPELRQILQTIERVFLQPLRGPDPRLRKADVESFLSIDSMAQLWMLCGLNPNGLNGIVGAQHPICGPYINEGGEASAATYSGAGRPSTVHATTVNGVSPKKTHALDPYSDLDDDDDAIYDIQQLLGPDSDRPVTIRNVPATALPTPPPTAERSGLKRKTGPGREESPTKRLAQGM